MRKTVYRKVRLLSFGSGRKEHVFIADEKGYVERNSIPVCGRNRYGAPVCYRHDTIGMCEDCKRWMTVWTINNVEHNLLDLSQEIYVYES